MSSYYEHEYVCPKCGHGPIRCADNYFGPRIYGYICDKDRGGCGYVSKDWKEFKKRDGDK